MQARIGTDTQTNQPVKQVAFRFNGMSGPGPAFSDQMLRVGNVHKYRVLGLERWMSMNKNLEELV